MRATAAMILIACLPSMARAAEYGPMKSTFPSKWGAAFFTALDAKGRTAWQKAVAVKLAARGFSERQIGRFSSLSLPLADPPRAEFHLENLPVKFNPETGRRMPLDPDGFAAALPDCFKTDERSCAMTWSATAFVNMPVADKANVHGLVVQPCLMPERTKSFCSRVGYRRGASCGESERGGDECGASDIVFDGGGETTKLAMADTDALAKAAPPPAAATKPAAEAKSYPRIVYKANRGKITRTGPAEYEEWELNRKAAECVTGDACGKLWVKASGIRYCWPHNVARPSSCVIP